MAKKQTDKELKITVIEGQKTKQMFKEGEDRAQALLNAVTDPSFLMDANGIILALNQTAAEGFGKEIDELVGICEYDLIPAYLAKSRKAKVNNVIRTGKRVRFEDKRGGRFFDNSIYPVFGTDGNVVAVVVYARDVTKEKTAEEEMSIANEKLKIKIKNLEELNAAMAVLLEKRKQDKKEIEDNVQTNVKKLIEPYFKKIKNTKLDDQQKVLIGILESNLKEISSPFTRKMSLKHLELTPKEIQVANLVMQGIQSKKIAELMKISPRTVDTHRKKIRRKVGLNQKRANLRSYLLNLH